MGRFVERKNRNDRADFIAMLKLVAVMGILVVGIILYELYWN